MKHIDDYLGFEVEVRVKAHPGPADTGKSRDGLGYLAIVTIRKAAASGGARFMFLAVAARRSGWPPVPERSRRPDGWLFRWTPFDRRSAGQRSRLASRLHITDLLRVSDSYCRCVDRLAVRLRTNGLANFLDNGVCSSRLPAALMNMEAGPDRHRR